MKLGELVTVRGGKRLPKGIMLTPEKTSHPYITVKNLDPYKTQLTDSFEYVPDEVFPSISHYVVNADDVVISIVGTIGRVSIIGETLNGASLTENCAKLEPKQGILSKYLFYFLSSPAGQARIQQGIVGTTQPKLPFYNIEGISVSLPPLAEQHHIVDAMQSRS